MSVLVVLSQLAFTLACSGLHGRRPSAEPERPNIVFVLADDLGWTHVGFNGAELYETPHLDRLAAEGVVFRRGYSCGPNCAPTRACLLSGTYTPRHHIYTPGTRSKGKWPLMKLRVPALKAPEPVDFPPSLDRLDPSVTSFAEVLGGAGYATARLGKWHLGPDVQGFALHSSDGTPGKEGRHYGNVDVAEKLTDAALGFVEEHRDQPFCLYLAHWDVHTPIRAREDVVQRFRDKQEETGLAGNPIYAGMIHAVDHSVGRLRAKLEELGLSERTLFVFSSDNGGLPHVSDNAPLRAGKGSLYEGGIRVPTCMAWPGVIAPGGRCDTPITSVDYLPTFAELAGAELPADQPADGVSLVPLFGGGALPERPIFWFFPLYLSGAKGNKPVAVHGTEVPYWRATPAAAVVLGPWKLILRFEDRTLELYDLDSDPAEANDLTKEQPERRRQLLALLEGWLEETNAPVPSELNPDFDPAQAGGAR